jgi:hypothetical protein
MKPDSEEEVVTDFCSDILTALFCKNYWFYHSVRDYSPSLKAGGVVTGGCFVFLSQDEVFWRIFHASIPLTQSPAVTLPR